MLCKLRAGILVGDDARACAITCRGAGACRSSRSAREVHRARADLVPHQPWRADAGPGSRLGRGRRGSSHAHARADRQRQDARGVLLRARSPGARTSHAWHARALHLADQGARVRYRAQPARAARRPATARRGDRRHGRCPHRRHADQGARAPAPRPRPRPDHDARVAVPAARGPRARPPARGRHRHRRRDPRARDDQARRPPRAVARAPRRAHRPRSAAHRAIRHATST